MKSLAKADATLRDLAEVLKRRFDGSATIDTVRELRDSDGWPMLICSDGGTETAGNPVIGVRVKSYDAVSKDVFGNDLDAFTPHHCEIAYELDTGNPEPSALDLTEVTAELAKRGFALEIKEIADGTAVDATSMSAKEADRVIEVQDEWPTKGA